MGKYFTPDHRGLEQILTGPEVTAMVTGFAADVAADIQAQFPEVEVVTDVYEFTPSRRAGRRAAASVTFKRADGRAREVRDGLLTRAAAGRGAEVRSR